ncbi:glycosyltransferase [Microvirga massiliensis]|uniref:glycosyltransferase n=1 Tax=Microvirga massiliensis TaxID=1033741 RepID=UPI0009E4433C|nr:glycosyltransferase [Microvirga massiliensis]
MQLLHPPPDRFGPQLLQVEGRNALVLIDTVDPPTERVAFDIDGQPVAASIVHLHSRDFLRQLNLLRNGRFDDECSDWHPIGVADTLVQTGRDIAPQWTLSGGHTGFVSVPSHVESIEVLYSDSSAPGDLSIAAGERYAFEGLFGSHRCRADLRLTVFDVDGDVIADHRRSIEKKPGGNVPSGYAKVNFSFRAPRGAASVRIGLTIRRDEEAQIRSAEPAVLFMTGLAFGACEQSPVSWRNYLLNRDAVERVRHGAHVVQFRLPRMTSGEFGKDVEVNAVDRHTGKPLTPTPILLRGSPGLSFHPYGFDGVTLSGALSGAAGGEVLDLLVDSEPAATLAVPSPTDMGAQKIALRIADRFLDGSPRLVEVSERETGQILYQVAEVLKPLTTDWAMLGEQGWAPWLSGHNPLARERYRSLALHIEAADEHGGNDALVQLQQCHSVLRQSNFQLSDLLPLRVPESAQPDVSIVVDAGESATDAYRSVAAILFAFNRATFDITLVHSLLQEDRDRLQPLLDGLTFLEVLPGEPRSAALNRAAFTSKGRFIAFLGRQSEPASRWLDELIYPVELFDRIGAVSAQVLDGNGRLRETGARFLVDGRLEAITGSGNPNSPEFSHTRQIDAVSRSGLLIARSVWEQVGGFSEAFATDNQIDADLCLKVRAAGLRICVAPLSSISILSASWAASEPLPFGDDNWFKRKWAGLLREAPSRTGNGIRRPDPDGSRRVLFIDQQLPRIDIDAGSYAAIQEMRLFQALNFRVSFLPLNLLHLGAYTEALLRMGVEALHAPFCTSLEQALAARAGQFDVVYITRYNVAQSVIPLVRRYQPDTKIVFNVADLHFLRELRAGIAEKRDDQIRRSRLTRDAEFEVIRQVDLTLSYSDTEQAIILSHQLGDANVARVSWIVEPTSDVPAFENRRDIAFLGSFGHRPNVEAVKFFAAEVLPVLRRRMPGIQVNIFGSQMSAEVAELEQDGLVVHGHVEDLREVFDRARLFIAPLRSGAGIKGKVLAAMAAGIPTILSPIAVEGIAAKPRTDFLLAESPAQWVDAIVDAYGNEKLWTSLSNSALNLVRDSYSFPEALHAMRAALERVDIFAPREGTALACRSVIPPLA